MRMADIRRSRIVGFFRKRLMLCAEVLGSLQCPVKIADTQLSTACDGGKDGKSRGNSSSHPFAW